MKGISPQTATPVRGMSYARSCHYLTKKLASKLVTNKEGVVIAIKPLSKVFRALLCVGSETSKHVYIHNARDNAIGLFLRMTEKGEGDCQKNYYILAAICVAE